MVLSAWRYCSQSTLSPDYMGIFLSFTIYIRGTNSLQKYESYRVRAGGFANKKRGKFEDKFTFSFFSEKNQNSS